MRQLVTMAHSGYVLVGVISMLLPIILPSLLHDFALTPAAVGLLFPVKAAGALLGSLSTGVVSDRIGRRPVVAGSGLLLAAALLLMALSGSWPAVAAGFLALGVAQAVLVTGINALTADLHGSGQRVRAFNWLHAMYSVGAAVAPLLLGAALFWGDDWRPLLAGLGGILLLFGAVAGRVQYPAVARAAASEDEPARASAPVTGAETGGEEAAAEGVAAHGGLDTPARPLVALPMLRDGIFLVFFAVAFLYNGLAWSLLGWLNFYLEEVLALPALSGAAALSVFYVALAAGRFGTPYVTERVGRHRVMLLLAVGTGLAYPLVLAWDHLLLILAGCFLCGLFLAGFYPLALAWANDRFPHRGGAVAGTLSVAMILGSMVPPWWTGVLGTVWSLRGALAANGIMVLPLLLIGLYFLRRGSPVAQG